MQNKNILYLVLATALILLVPFLAMQFTDEIAWGPFDFVLAGALVFGTGFVYELIVSKGGTFAYRAGLGLALAAGFMLVFINLAVGIIGSEANPANLMYFGVLVVGMIGAFLARFRPAGMARTLLAMALAQALVTGIGLAAGTPVAASEHALWAVVKVLGVNTMFIVLFIGSAWLFRRTNAT